ncbi:hypothetical protein, partial [Bartonella sp. AP4SXKL]|uniref:hypothetical protein n=1 Tax=Bartonella sp. AP4SXKL TaxID=3243496 RepID=UPI0035D0DFA1
MQRLTTEFELIRMSETETFDQFHKRLRQIVNTLDNLGEKIQKNRVVKKILSSLPDKFVPKIIAIEENKDLNILTEVDLVGSLQHFEADLISRSSNNNHSKKEKSTALKTVNNQSESDNDSNDEFDEEAMAYFTKKFRNYLEKEKKYRSNPNKGKENFKKKFR